ncbi:EexN family lipoprotein [Sphingopyxis sp. MG]|uniref:EexN family lipoprotein n=1 Tax=Sphingopyxis sp. MG TaxID=1866325 RepID=UPI00131A2916|nr:EexN family lipoprotein [Sphingopyxis sp. MG]
MKARAIGAMLIGTAISGCGQAEPRSKQYFDVHIDEARQVVEGCRDGSVRGGECDNAESAVNRTEAKERAKRFLGDGKAYTSRHATNAP